MTFTKSRPVAAPSPRRLDKAVLDPYLPLGPVRRGFLRAIDPGLISLDVVDDADDDGTAAVRVLMLQAAPR